MSEHTLDGREKTLDRLETIARERWGDQWTIRTNHFADRTIQAHAFRSRGVVDDDRDAKILEEERLYVGDDRIEFCRVHVRREDVVDVLESETSNETLNDCRTRNKR